MQWNRKWYRIFQIADVFNTNPLLIKIPDTGARRCRQLIGSRLARTHIVMVTSRTG